MRSGNENLLRVADRASRAVPLPHDFAVFYKRAVFHRLRAAEKRHLALDLSRHFEKHGIVHVQNGVVTPGLIFKDPLLQTDILAPWCHGG